MRLLQRRTVVYTVSGDGDDMAIADQGCDDRRFLRWLHAGVDAGLSRDLVQPLVARSSGFIDVVARNDLARVKGQA